MPKWILSLLNPALSFPWKLNPAEAADAVIISTAEHQPPRNRYQQLPCYSIEAWLNVVGK